MMQILYHVIKSQRTDTDLYFYYKDKIINDIYIFVSPFSRSKYSYSILKLTHEKDNNEKQITQENFDKVCCYHLIYEKSN